MGAVFLFGGPAWAHVTINPESALKGSDAVLAFSVPDESETLSTTDVQVFFPKDHPIAEALQQPIPGWTSSVTTFKPAKPIKTDTGTVTEAVESVTWKGGSIAPGHFQQFVVSVGLPADASALAFPTLQTYSDGSVVRWIEGEPPGGGEAEHPVPTLTLTSATDGATTPTTAAVTTGAQGKNLATKSDVDSAKSLGVVGVIVGAIGLVAAIGAIVLGRRPRSA
jgi:uncharacterized protein YcnI